ncbi:MAG: elongation factor T [Parcubacteria group bacterium Gr01-1014_48]|nr:MAG: elongation factor T [Parcubacteria group bacterium Greene0416_14]TSC74079.1 MAG: elongation factor T [Parcubacteria group bacterium Gr01-1014_48]TSD01134.1 MAG: elongation factor T [Parcubacteria group bacterium Greene1014_15]TSD08210.1 MAG: elongation factor T [Parcubacteria group bacterium Greene0714_4]
MSIITTETIKTLRDRTGISIMQCKKALEETDGNIEQALVVLRKKGGEIASKKKDRTLGSGIVQAYIHATGALGAVVILACETDFVAKNEEFSKLAYDIAMHVTAINPEFLKADDVPESAKEIARSVFVKEIEGKPAELQEKIMEGKLNTYFKEKILLDQQFIKNPDITIQGLIDSAIQKFGEKIEISRFERFVV